MATREEVIARRDAKDWIKYFEIQLQLVDDDGEDIPVEQVKAEINQILGELKSGDQKRIDGTLAYLNAEENDDTEGAL